MADVLAICWRRYLEKLDHEPVKTKALTAALIAALADIIAQRISKRAALHWRRTLAVALYGLVWVGPSNHYWQLFLENIIPKRRGDTLRPVKKVLLDQCTFGPLNTLMFMTWVALVVEGRSPPAARRKVLADYPSVQLKAWRLWPAAALVNQVFVPLQLRVLWNNCVSLLWSTFLITHARSAEVSAERQLRHQLSLTKRI